MRVEVDRVVCEANGVCEAIAPEVFRLGDDDELEILAATVPAGREDDVRRAVASCPKAALSLAEDED